MTSTEFGPRPGDIGMIEVKGFVGWLIRFGQWLNGDGFGPVQHLFVYVLDKVTGKLMIVEAEPNGARMVHTETYSGRFVWMKQCPDEFREAVSAAAIMLVGTPYSFLDYLALAMTRFSFVDQRIGLVGKTIADFVAATGHMICSQLGDEAAKRGGWHLFNDGRLPQAVTPSAVWFLDHPVRPAAV